MAIFDPRGEIVFWTATSGSVGLQGGTELFLESAEPEFSELSLAELLKRFPAGEYQFRGAGLEGERYLGTAMLTHDIPDGPSMMYPIEGSGLVDSRNATLLWEGVPPPNGSPGFLQPDTEYEWEVLAIELGGNQTLSSSFFTTTP